MLMSNPSLSDGVRYFSVGATHFDYIMQEEPLSIIDAGLTGVGADLMQHIMSAEDLAWNKRVSDFVPTLIDNSQTNENLDSFLRSLGTSLAHKDEVNGTWIITLPGSESRI